MNISRAQTNRFDTLVRRKQLFALMLALCLLALGAVAFPVWAADEESEGGESESSEAVQNTEAGAEDSADSSEDSAGSSGETKQLTGLTIVGAKEAPKSLILVPWKDSNVDVTTDFGTLVDSVEIEPIDRPSLERRILFDDLVREDLEAARLAAEQQADDAE